MKKVKVSKTLKFPSIAGHAERQVEAILFAAEEPLDLKSIQENGGFFLTLSELKNRPEVENLLGIYSSLQNQNIEKSINEYSGKNFSHFKDKISTRFTIKS